MRFLEHPGGERFSEPISAVAILHMISTLRLEALHMFFHFCHAPISLFKQKKLSKSFVVGTLKLVACGKPPTDVYRTG